MGPHNIITPEIIKKFHPKNFGPFRFKRLDKETFLITNDSGKYSYLTPDQFKLFLTGGISDEKKDELINKGFLEISIDGLANDFAKKHTFLATGPTTHIIILTLRCNHACKYCHASVVPMDSEGHDLTREKAQKIVDTIFFSTAHEITIEFQGGEPLVNWDVMKFIIEYAKYKSLQVSKKVNFALVSNLSLMTQEKLMYLLQEGIGLNTSLDGDEKTHNFNRVYHSGNSYELVTYWIREIQRISREVFGHEYHISPLLTVTKATLKNWKNCVDVYIDIGSPQLFWRPINPLGFGALAYKQLGYSPEEFLTVYELVLDYIIEKNRERNVMFREAYATIFLKKILTTSDPNYVDTRSPCGAVIGQVAYNFDGKIYSCDEGRMLAKMGDDSFCVGEIGLDPRDTYVNMINSPVTKSIISSSVLEGLPGYESDAYAPFLGSCAVLNYKAHGSIYPYYSMDNKRKIESGILDLLFVRLKDKDIEKIFRSWL